jgi:hypothetical protein
MWTLDIKIRTGVNLENLGEYKCKTSIGLGKILYTIYNSLLKAVHSEGAKYKV